MMGVDLYEAIDMEGIWGEGDMFEGLPVIGAEGQEEGEEDEAEAEFDATAMLLELPRRAVFHAPASCEMGTQTPPDDMMLPGPSVYSFNWHTPTINFMENGILEKNII